MKNVITYTDASQLYTAEQIAQFEREEKERLRNAEIADCKAQLSATDYKCWKFAEGEISAEEYEPIRLERRALRARINELEKEL